MNNYVLFQLTKEPFSNSPDPDLFYHSVQHHDCLQKLELALRLRRGLSVVIGDIGTGKSTMCRALLRLIDNEDSAISAHVLLDPEFTSPLEFLQTIVTTFGIENCDCSSEWQMKEAIKNHLFHQGVDLHKIPVLIIDEGQKLPDFCIEILREFLNFETNQNKLLEIVIFAQEEFEETLKKKANFTDRITTFHKLVPLSFKETRKMVRYRIQQCQEDPEAAPSLFPLPTLWLIHRISRGYPRKIVMLCSKILIAMLVKNKKRANILLVLSSAGETSIPLLRGSRKGVYAIGLLLLLTPGVVFYTNKEMIQEKIHAGLLSGKNILQQTTSYAEKAAILTKKNILQQTTKHEEKAVILPDKNILQQTTNHKEKAGMASPVAQEVEAKKDETVALTTTKRVESTASMRLEDQEKTPPMQLENNADDELSASNPPPDELGHLMVVAGTSLSRMVARVYGKFTDRSLRMVLRANPYLSNPARLKINAKIFFPRLQNSPASKLTPFLIQLGEFASLQEAYNFIITYPETEDAAIIAPLWDGVSRLSFLVVLEENFADEEQAWKKLVEIDGRFQSAASVLKELKGILF